ncbi:hypothetical protein [Martelella sp.]|nr:hypothetical protein [Martelella sp.]|tara:strand:+ start:612 stop:761 length:150 start_codon:yes stop_codon:yes gene_type:complete
MTADWRADSPGNLKNTFTDDNLRAMFGTGLSVGQSGRTILPLNIRAARS